MNIRKNIKDRIKKDFDINIVLIQIGCFFQVIDEDAIFFIDNFDFKLYKNELFSGDIAGFPVGALDHYKSKLDSIGEEYCVVEQTGKNKGKFTRAVTFSTIKGAEGINF